MIINEDYIRKFTEDNLWQLDKSDVQRLATTLKIEFKRNDTKDSLLTKIKRHADFDLMQVYDMFKGGCFGLYPTEAQRLLDIDNKVLKKLAKKGIINVAYTRKTKMYGSYVDVPYYLMENLLKLSKDDLAIAIQEHCKAPSAKQLAAIQKARETSLKNRTCVKCFSIVGKKTDLSDGKCTRCIEEEEFIKNQTRVKQEYKAFLAEKDKYIILDTETTGLNSDDEIVEIAIIDLDGNPLLDTLVQTEKLISEEASAVNGILNSDLVGKPTIKELTPILDYIFKDKTILIFNSEFDVRMLRQSGYDGKVESRCLMYLYMDYIDSERWVGLTRAMSYEGIDIIQNHRAISDCQCCLELIKKIANS